MGTDGERRWEYFRTLQMEAEEDESQQPQDGEDDDNIDGAGCCCLGGTNDLSFTYRNPTGTFAVLLFVGGTNFRKRDDKELALPELESAIPLALISIKLGKYCVIL